MTIRQENNLLKKEGKKKCCECLQTKAFRGFRKERTRGNYLARCKQCHRVLVRNRLREWSKSPKNIYKVIVRNALSRRIPMQIEEKNFIVWWNDTPNTCCYCNQTIENCLDKSKFRLTIDRKDNKKGYQIENIIKAC